MVRRRNRRVLWMLRWQESVGSGSDPRVLRLEMTLTRLFHHQANLLLTSLAQTKSLLSSDTPYTLHYCPLSCCWFHPYENSNLFFLPSVNGLNAFQIKKKKVYAPTANITVPDQQRINRLTDRVLCCCNMRICGFQWWIVKKKEKRKKWALAWHGKYN